MSWLMVSVLIAGAYGFKVLGVFGLAGHRTGRVANRMAALTALIPAALFAALIVVQTLGSDQSISVDARLGGLLASVVAVSRRAPFVVVVVVAMAATATLRAVAG